MLWGKGRNIFQNFGGVGYDNPKLGGRGGIQNLGEGGRGKEKNLVQN